MSVIFYTFRSLKVQIPCHKHNLKPFLADYIYHKNEKGKPGEMDLPLLKNDITDIFDL